MSNESKDIITNTLKEVYPETKLIMIDSALLSAQRRKRYYWTNFHVEQPEDKGIILEDILEDGIVIRGEKANTITTSCGRMIDVDYFKRHKGNMKAYCIDANYWKGSSLEYTLEKHKRELVAVPVALRNKGNGKKPEFNGTDKLNSLTTVSTDSMICEPIRIGTLPGLGKGQANRIYSVKGKCICLNANGGGGGAKTGLYKVDLPDSDYLIRRLTPIECERAQTLPDNFTAGISNTRRYQCIGNGWTVDVIAHIFRAMKQSLIDSNSKYQSI